jgi:alpha-tubulin suppressor-like RCC1 family protein
VTPSKNTTVRSDRLRAARAILLAGLVGCVEQVVIPNAVVSTLDDPASGIYASVSGGFEHTCATTTSNAAFCWGSNEFGQLGGPAVDTCVREDREVPCATIPRPVSGSFLFAEVGAGGKHSCGRTFDAVVYCWGDNFNGQLGDPAFRSSSTPIPVGRAGPYVAIAVGGEHSCALRTDGAAFCWGGNDQGQLGIGSSGPGSGSPDSVRTLLRFVSITAGAKRTCARAADGALYCWGATWVARLNAGEAFRAQTFPQRMQPPALFKAVAVGANSTCAIATQSGNTEENTGFCWEANPTGTIGNGTAAGSSAPQPVVGGLRFLAISSGASHSCGVADTGLVYCWGAGSFGQLGVSPVFLNFRCGSAETPCSTVPTRIAGWRLFSEITTGQGDHTCALTISGNVYCWGAGSLGQRGDGRTGADWSPRMVNLPSSLQPPASSLPPQ